MESLRRPALLAAVAAGLLVLNVALLTGDDDDAPTVAVDAPADDAEEAGGDDGDGDVASQEDDGAATDEPPADGDQDDDGVAEDDAAGTDDEGATTDGALAAPAAGTYAYASSGTWSLTGGASPEEYELPATATAEVAGDGEWTVHLEAGDRYADRFTFTVGPDGGLDWTDWVLERTSPSLADATVYSCSGDTAWYRPDEQGRVAQHVCTAGGITSTGTVEHLGTEEVQLGDGTVAVADRLLYAYTVDGPGVSGEGQLDLWLDPATGLRLQEQRRIVTTATSDDTDYEYREDVAFTLQSLDPA